MSALVGGRHGVQGSNYAYSEVLSIPIWSTQLGRTIDIWGGPELTEMKSLGSSQFGLNVFTYSTTAPAGQVQPDLTQYREDGQSDADMPKNVISLQPTKGLPIAFSRPLLDGVNAGVKGQFSYAADDVAAKFAAAAAPLIGGASDFLTMDIEPVSGLPVQASMSGQVNIAPSRTPCYYPLAYDGFLLPLFTTSISVGITEAQMNAFADTYENMRMNIVDAFSIWFSVALAVLMLSYVCCCISARMSRKVHVAAQQPA